MHSEYPMWIYPGGDVTKGVKVNSAAEAQAILTDAVAFAAIIPAQVVEPAAQAAPPEAIAAPKPRAKPGPKPKGK